MKKNYFPIITGIMLTITINITYGQDNLWNWAISSGNSLQDAGYGVTTDPSGNIFMVGDFSDTISFGAITLYGHTVADMFIVKYDSSGTVQWAKSSGGAQTETARGVATDASGNVFVTGSFDSDTIFFGTDTLIKNAGGNMYLVKYDGSGNVLWAKRSDGSPYGYITPYSLTVDINNDVYVTGGFNNDTINFDGHYLYDTDMFSVFNDMFTVKFSGSTGTAQWAKSAVISNVFAEENGWDIVSDGSGNVIVTGEFSSDSVTFGTYTLINHNPNYSETYIVKYNGTGTVLWARSGKGIYNDGGRAVSVDASGNIYVCGVFDSDSIQFGSATLYNNGFKDISTIKYDANGNVQWAKSFGGTYIDEVTCMDVDNQGNIYVCGYFGSTNMTIDTFVLTKDGLTDIFLVKYDTGGNVAWARLEGGPGDDRGIGFVNNGNDQFCMSGAFDSDSISFGTHTLYNVNQWDIFLARWGMCTKPVAKFGYTSNAINYVLFHDSSSNATSWHWDFGDGNYGTEKNPVHIYTGSGGPYVVTLTAINDCGSSVFTDTVSPLINMTNSNSVNNLIRIYPNPTKNNIFFELDNFTGKDMLIEVINIYGKEMIKKKFTSQYGSIDLAGLTNGTYFVKFSNELSVRIQRIVKQ